MIDERNVSRDVEKPDLVKLTECEFVELLKSARESLVLLKRIRTECLANKEKSFFIHLSTETVHKSVAEFMNEEELDLSVQLEYSILYLVMERCHFIGSMSIEGPRITSIFTKSFEKDRDTRQYAIELLSQVCKKVPDIFTFVENTNEFYKAIDSLLDFDEKFKYLKETLFKLRPTKQEAIESYLELTLGFCQNAIDAKEKPERELRSYIHLGILLVGHILRFSRPLITYYAYARMEKVLEELFMSKTTMNDDKLSILSLIKCQLSQLEVNFDWITHNPLIREVLLDSERILPRLTLPFRFNLQKYSKKTKNNIEMKELLSLAIMAWNRKEKRYPTAKLIQTNDYISRDIISSELTLIHRKDEERPLAEQLWVQLDRCEDIDFNEDQEGCEYVKNFKNLDDENLCYLYKN